MRRSLLSSRLLCRAWSLSRMREGWVVDRGSLWSRLDLLMPWLLAIRVTTIRQWLHVDIWLDLDFWLVLVWLL